MEEIFEFLPGLIILFGVGSGLLKKLKELLSGIENQANTNYSKTKLSDAELESEAESFFQEQENKDKQRTNTKQQTKEKQSTKNRRQISRRRAQTSERKNTTTDKIKASEGKVLTEKDFNRREITKGVIFKEILDKPRSKKPHSFFRGEK